MAVTATITLPDDQEQIAKAIDGWEVPHVNDEDALDLTLAVARGEVEEARACITRDPVDHVAAATELVARAERLKVLAEVYRACALRIGGE